ncbi:MFS transporter [Microlunatus endophyticus]|uniref:Putative tartrate transporter n=1 Tax=Microlunatus endophyticus TaxID=1716077 RepID=A0A917SDL1_9ACTN|nr:MFS transporter [Microlunatus endophyticus]GGL71763.1 MFS transporter [Microlunatus endophyticus]
MSTTQPNAAASVADDQFGSRVVRKVTLRLVPFMGLLYFVNYLDRTNIGFAKLTMDHDLGLSETAYGLASGLFFIGYLILEVPSNLILHRVGARRWIARIMVSWGIIAALTTFVPNAGTLYVMRILLGIAEAGFFPGMILFLTFWFPERERAKVTGLFMMAIPLSSALGSPISGALLQYAEGAFGLAGWRSMFLFEGIPAIILGVICWFFLTDRPADAKWLTPQERDWLSSEIAGEVKQADEEYGWTLRRSLTSPRILALAFVYFGVVYGLYAVSFFLPSIVAGFAQRFGTDFSLVQTGLITAIPYVIGAIAMVLWTRHADKTRERVWHLAIPAILGAVAIPIALYLNSPFLVMVMVSIAAIGIYSALPVFWPLPSFFLTGAAAAGGIALINGLGNLAGFLAPFVTGWTTDLTGSEKAGLWIVGVLMLGSAATVVGLGKAPKRRNPEPVEGH